MIELRHAPALLAALESAEDAEAEYACARAEGGPYDVLEGLRSAAEAAQARWAGLHNAMYAPVAIQK